MADFNSYDVIVVGSGLTGSVIAREHAEKGKKVQNLFSLLNVS